MGKTQSLLILPCKFGISERRTVQNIFYQCRNMKNLRDLFKIKISPKEPLVQREKSMLSHFLIAIFVETDWLQQSAKQTRAENFFILYFRFIRQICLFFRSRLVKCVWKEWNVKENHNRPTKPLYYPRSDLNTKVLHAYLGFLSHTLPTRSTRRRRKEKDKSATFS